MTPHKTLYISFLPFCFPLLFRFWESPLDKDYSLNFQVVPKKRYYKNKHKRRNKMMYNSIRQIVYRKILKYFRNMKKMMLPYFIFTMNLVINLMNIPQYNEMVFIFCHNIWLYPPPGWILPLEFTFCINGELFIIVYPCNTN